MQVTDLKEGQVLLESVRKVANDKFQIQIAQKFPANRGGSEITSEMNADDERFQGGGAARRTWITGGRQKVKDTIEKNLGEEFELPEAEYEWKEVGVADPTTLSGKSIGIQVFETVYPTDYEKENYQDRAKRAGQDGPILTHNGYAIFSRTYPTVYENGEKKDKDQFLSHDQNLSTVSNEPIKLEGEAESAPASESEEADRSDLG